MKTKHILILLLASVSTLKMPAQADFALVGKSVWPESPRAAAIREATLSLPTTLMTYSVSHKCEYRLHGCVTKIAPLPSTVDQIPLPEESKGKKKNKY